LFNGESQLKMEEAVLLDFGSKFARFRDTVKHYADLSESGNCEEAISRVYDMLRWAETKEDCSHVLITDLSKMGEGQSEHLPALFDRLYRAASGKSA
jgi:hypothetical protein